MKTNTFVQVVAYFTIIVGLAVFFGWLFNITMLKSISPNYPTMKLTSALAFVLSGFITLLLQSNKPKKSKAKTFIMCIMSLFLLIGMLVYLIYTIYDLSPNLQGSIIDELAHLGNGSYTSIPGRLSMGTMISFILIALAAVADIFNIKNERKIQMLLGMLVIVIGAVAILGFILNNPYLYYFVESSNAGMAFSSAFLFVLNGWTIFLLGKENTAEN